MNASLLRLCAVAAIALAAEPAMACGPYYSVPYLHLSGNQITDLPKARFDREVATWATSVQVPGGVVGKRVRTTEADRLDLTAALEAHPDRDALVAAYLKARSAETEIVADSIPEEFRRYQSAIVAMYRDDISGAVQQLQALLTLPADQRHYRSTWAAYMLGALHSAPLDRQRSLEQVRSLAGAGFADTLGLAASSFRRQSGEAEDQGQSAEALAHCANYLGAGGKYGCAQRLRHLTNQVINDPAQQRLAATLAPAADIVSIALTADYPGYGDEAQAAHLARVRSWLNAVSSTDQAPPLAGRLAWAAYRAGDQELGQAWVQRALPNDGVAAWVDAKMALERGDLERAGTSLERAIEGMQTGRQPHHARCGHHHDEPIKAAQVELGIVRVAQDRPTDAMQLFLDSGAWMDAAWVGERLLSVQELTAIVQQRAPQTLHTPAVDPEMYGTSGYLPMLLHGDDMTPAEEPGLLRGLLGRRLVREGRLADARPFLPFEARPHLDQVIQDLALATNEGNSAGVRGGAYWRAAFTLKQEGWALSATELEPDHRVLGGWYPGLDTAEQRANPQYEVRMPQTSNERQRIDASHNPEERYHFVYTSTDMALKALQIMPDHHPDLPQAACVTGNWMRHRDPQIAWKTSLQLQNRAPESKLAKAISTEFNWWGVNEEGTCAMPDGTPIDVERTCSTVPLTLPWWGALLLLASRRRRRSIRPR